MDGKTWRSLEKQEVSGCNRKVNAPLKPPETWKRSILSGCQKCSAAAGGGAVRKPANANVLIHPCCGNHSRAVVKGPRKICCDSWLYLHWPTSQWRAFATPSLHVPTWLLMCLSEVATKPRGCKLESASCLPSGAYEQTPSSLVKAEIPRCHVSCFGGIASASPQARWGSPRAKTLSCSQNSHFAWESCCRCSDIYICQSWSL